MNCVLLYWRLLPVRLLYNDFGESWCWLSERNYHDELLLASPDRNFSSGSSGSVGILNSGGLILLFFLFWFWSKRWLHCRVHSIFWKNQLSCLFIFCIKNQHFAWKLQLTFSFFGHFDQKNEKRKMDWIRQINAFRLLLTYRPL